MISFLQEAMADTTESPESIPKDDTWENRVKYYCQQATKMFVNAATEIRNVALNQSPPKGLGKGIQVAISATVAAVGAEVGAAVGAGSSIGAKGGKLAGKAVDLMIQVYCHNWWDHVMPKLHGNNILHQMKCE